MQRRLTQQIRRPGTLVLDVLGPLQIHGRSYPEGLVHLRRQPEGNGYRETVLFGLSQGEQPPDPDSEELFAELLAELETARQRLHDQLLQLTGKLERLGAKQDALR